MSNANIPSTQKANRLIQYPNIRSTISHDFDCIILKSQYSTRLSAQSPMQIFDEYIGNLQSPH